MIEFKLWENPQNYRFGAYGIVIFNNNCATKIFAPRKDKPETNMNDVYKSEVEAYEKIWKTGEAEELQKITPKFFGEVKEHEVIKVRNRNPDNNKMVISELPPEFESKRAYKMEYVKSPFKKLGLLFSKEREYIKNHLTENGFSETSIGPLRDTIITLFKNHNIRHVIDADVAIDKERGKIWFIDFGIEEHVIEHE